MNLSGPASQAFDLSMRPSSTVLSFTTRGTWPRDTAYFPIPAFFSLSRCVVNLKTNNTCSFGEAPKVVGYTLHLGSNHPDVLITQSDSRRHEGITHVSVSLSIHMHSVCGAILRW